MRRDGQTDVAEVLMLFAILRTHLKNQETRTSVHFLCFKNYIYIYMCVYIFMPIGYEPIEYYT
jgi:hypothetical protein